MDIFTNGLVIDTEKLPVGTPVIAYVPDVNGDIKEEIGVVADVSMDHVRVRSGNHSFKIRLAQLVTNEKIQIVPLVPKQDLIDLQERLAEYERQGGVVNMERSWKVKYRNALRKANERLKEAGLEPVRIRNQGEQEMADETHQQPVGVEDLDVKHMKIENEVVDRISRYLDTPAAEWAIRDLIQPLVDELARMRREVR